MATPSAFASSHREAPFLTGQPKLDATDLYMFRSYETGRQNFVTILANYQPFQDPQGGPNFYMFNPEGLYEIHIDNNGDAVEDIAADTLQVGCKPSDAPAGGLALTDGVRKTAANYGVTFPYLTTPIPGNFNPPAAAGTLFP